MEWALRRRSPYLTPRTSRIDTVWEQPRLNPNPRQLYRPPCNPTPPQLEGYLSPNDAVTNYQSQLVPLYMGRYSCHSLKYYFTKINGFTVPIQTAKGAYIEDGDVVTLPTGAHTAHLYNADPSTYWYTGYYPFI